MALPNIIRPHVQADPTLESAIWLQQLRFVAVAGQLAVLAAVVFVLRIELPWLAISGLIATTALTNIAYAVWLRRLGISGLQLTDRLPSEHIVSSLMLSDIIVLTGMLYLSAGLANPFALFYFVNIAVAGAILSPAWAWIIWFATVLGVTVLLNTNVPIAALSSGNPVSSDSGTGIWTIPRIGFLVSFSTCSGVITYFITALTNELRSREEALKSAEDARIRNRQLEAMATLAAGAAHELASPLSTIAVVAKELGLALQKQDAPPAITNDVDLIRSELDRCRQILDRMTSTAGEAAGERLLPVELDELCDESLLSLREPERIDVEVHGGENQSVLPLQAVAQAIRNTLQNALDASPTDKSVLMSARTDSDTWIIDVIDSGEGMTSEVLERIGEPFFTTKEPGRGMGLGSYLTENVVRRLGGTINYSSIPGEGTKVSIRLPTNPPS
ncbi:MAG TPA: sensor histidine kinase [Planctomycetaceae bacterium]|nr:sensor histidine kinase [Planctomycetaceae bacterium]